MEDNEGKMRSRGWYQKNRDRIERYARWGACNPRKQDAPLLQPTPSPQKTRHHIPRAVTDGNRALRGAHNSSSSVDHGTCASILNQAGLETRATIIPLRDALYNLFVFLDRSVPPDLLPHCEGFQRRIYTELQSIEQYLEHEAGKSHDVLAECCEVAQLRQDLLSCIQPSNPYAVDGRTLSHPYDDADRFCALGLLTQKNGKTAENSTSRLRPNSLERSLPNSVERPPICQETRSPPPLRQEMCRQASAPVLQSSAPVPQSTRSPPAPGRQEAHSMPTSFRQDQCGASPAFAREARSHPAPFHQDARSVSPKPSHQETYNRPPARFAQDTRSVSPDMLICSLHSAPAVLVQRNPPHAHTRTDRICARNLPMHSNAAHSQMLRQEIPAAAYNNAAQPALPGCDARFPVSARNTAAQPALRGCDARFPAAPAPYGCDARFLAAAHSDALQPALHGFDARIPAAAHSNAAQPLLHGFDTRISTAAHSNAAQPALRGFDARTPVAAHSNAAQPSLCGSDARIPTAAHGDAAQPAWHGCDARFPAAAHSNAVQPALHGFDRRLPATAHSNAAQPTLRGFDARIPAAASSSAAQPALHGFDRRLPVAAHSNTAQPPLHGFDRRPTAATHSDAAQPPLHGFDARIPAAAHRNAAQPELHGFEARIPAAAYSGAAQPALHGFDARIPSVPGIGSSAEYLARSSSPVRRTMNDRPIGSPQETRRDVRPEVDLQTSDRIPPRVVHKEPRLTLVRCPRLGTADNLPDGRMSALPTVGSCSRGLVEPITASDAHKPHGPSYRAGSSIEERMSLSRADDRIPPRDIAAVPLGRHGSPNRTPDVQGSKSPPCLSSPKQSPDKCPHESRVTHPDSEEVRNDAPLHRGSPSRANLVLSDLVFHHADA